MLLINDKIKRVDLLVKKFLKVVSCICWCIHFILNRRHYNFPPVGEISLDLNDPVVRLTIKIDILHHFVHHLLVFFGPHHTFHILFFND